MNKNFLRRTVWIYSFLFLSCLSNRLRSQQIIAYYSGKAKQINTYYNRQITEIIFSFCHLSGNRLKVNNKKDTITIR
ncbi:MAG TPA: hypothetical protein VHT72_09180, partial [Puia sp.]|nr:hypothetical protein [Puia sp.]